MNANATFASRRANPVAPTTSASWGRNRNAVRHQPRVSLGPVSHTITILLLVLVVGLIYLTQAAKVTSYDHEIAATDGEIATLEAERDSLAVENAKITAAAAAGNNDVAAAMADTNHGQFAE